MSKRINFTSETAELLKTTLSNCLCVADAFFFYEFFGSVKSEEPDFHGADDIPPKRFKPSRKRFYSMCAEAFGYKSWDELYTVSKGHGDDDIQTVFVHQDETLRHDLIGIFMRLFHEQFDKPKSELGKSYFFNDASKVILRVVNAIILNPLIAGKKPALYGLSEDSNNLLMITNFHELIPSFIKLDIHGDLPSSISSMMVTAEKYNMSVSPITSLDYDLDDEEVVLVDPRFFNAEMLIGSTESKHSFVGALDLAALTQEYYENLVKSGVTAYKTHVNREPYEITRLMLLKHSQLPIMPTQP